MSSEIQKCSDSLKLLNLETGNIRVSHDYILTAHNPTLSMSQPVSVLPNVSSLIIKLQIPSSRPEELSTQSSSAQLPNQSLDVEHNSRPTYTQAMYEPSKNYKYVPYYKEAPRNIFSSINEDKIVTGKRNTLYRENLLLADVVPYLKVVNSLIEAPEWKKAMDAEHHPLTSNNMGELVPYPAKPENVICGMWQLSCKRNEHGEIYPYKAQWVVLGNNQEYMLHYYDTWASVGRNEMFKVMLSLVINFNYIPYKFDIETGFLHGNMDVLVYVKQVKCYEAKGKKGWVWQLCKSPYGTNLASCMWKAKLTETLSSLGLASAQSDKSLFINNDTTPLIHGHVDNGFIISKTEVSIINLLDKLNSILKVKYKKKPTQHLGYNLNWSKNELKINQTDLIIKLLRQFGMNQYILFTTNKLSKYSLRPNQCHWNALKHLLRYLNGTKDKCLVYKEQPNKESLTGWADSDYANDREDRKSITGYVILAFSNTICWLIKKQLVVAQSTTEAEYVAMNIFLKQLQWLTFLFNDLGHSSLQPILFNDNSGAITISKQASLIANIKYIELRYQYVCDCVINNLIKVVQVSTNDMIADVLTKPLGVVNLQEVYKQLHLEDPGGLLKVEENNLVYI
ncbi:hypothetical protein O181_065918 [Austropuccinia psidii MF-1]|uniref:Reverse transcriptase Ty1/copia-type domain-containing protein n=1 Tax=Austropuccinia psidii MF-1 TaxID=1389203 RepID=A0A9Q3EQH5_9BASI|nr:hypothetical protein [Austropuccinia psidii MF-1]